MLSTHGLGAEPRASWAALVDGRGVGWAVCQTVARAGEGTGTTLQAFRRSCERVQETSMRTMTSRRKQQPENAFEGTWMPDRDACFW
jgi:hypothetical protein